MDEIYNFEELDSAQLDELGLTKDDLMELAIGISKGEIDTKDDNTFSFLFNNGLGMKVSYNVGIYDVDIWDDAGEVHVGSFLSFEKMLKGIAIICQDNFEDDYERDSFIGALYIRCGSFDDKIEIYIEDIIDYIN